MTININLSMYLFTIVRAAWSLACKKKTLEKKKEKNKEKRTNYHSTTLALFGLQVILIYTEKIEQQLRRFVTEHFEHDNTNVIIHEEPNEQISHIILSFERRTVYANVITSVQKIS